MKRGENDDRKQSICLKELRESLICLKIIIKAKLVESGKLESLACEADELISILVTSIKTAKKNIKIEEG